VTRNLSDETKAGCQAIDKCNAVKKDAKRGHSPTLLPILADGQEQQSQFAERIT
jgi:hypothetical protein